MNEATQYLGKPCRNGHAGLRYLSHRKCVECASRSRKKYNDKLGATAAADWHRQRSYGLTPAAFGALLIACDSQCSICRLPLAVGGVGPNGLTVDHCHLRGTVRGLLCNHCNRALGIFRDSPENLAAAISYLTRETNP